MTSLSMTPATFADVRAAVLTVTLAEAQALADRALTPVALPPNRAFLAPPKFIRPQFVTAETAEFLPSKPSYHARRSGSPRGRPDLLGRGVLVTQGEGR